jgi:hypothetical protein
MTRATPGRAVVTRRAAEGRGRGAVATSALTAVPAHNSSWSAGSGAALPADLIAAVAVAASPFTTAPGTTPSPPSLGGKPTTSAGAPA